MERPSELYFADENVKKEFKALKNSTTEDEMLYRWLLRAFQDIQKNVFCGIQTPKKLIPKGYVQKYGIKNLWKYNLPNAWRLLYSIEGRGVKIISIILEWLDRKNYENRFKY